MTQVPKKLTQLIGNHTAPTEFYEHIEQQIVSRIAFLSTGVLYTSRQLCGEEFWKVLGTNFCRRLAGRCFAHMVEQGRFPFEFVQYKRSPTKRYQLK